MAGSSDFRRVAAGFVACGGNLPEAKAARRFALDFDIERYR